MLYIIADRAVGLGLIFGKRILIELAELVGLAFVFHTAFVPGKQEQLRIGPISLGL